jgi:hypothetical protein
MHLRIRHLDRYILLLAQLLMSAWAAQGQTDARSAPAGVADVQQPIPFSHKKHSGFHVSCNYCHLKDADGVRIALPETAKCMMCHASIAKDSPPIQKLTEFHNQKKPVPWEQVYSVPEYVFWSHAVHLDAGVDCASCHGDIASMDVVRKVTTVTTMAGCVACHKQKGAPTGCLACHETQTSRWKGRIFSETFPEFLAVCQMPAIR